MSAHVNRGLAWIGIASSLVGLLDIVAILVILNTWVSVADYGIVTLCVWIFPILDQATDLGLSASVIQRDGHDDTTISTVFWINLLTAIVLFAALAIIAPIVATRVYGHAVIGWMLIAYGSKLLWQNIYFIPHALMKRELRFKELSVIRILANVAEFLGKIGFAAAGFGIWCFVLGPLCRVVVTGVGVQLRHPWRPKMIVKLRDARGHIAFGLKTSGSQILFYFYTNVDYPIVGYFFGDHALGIYKAAYEVVLEPVRIISHVIVDVAFPAFSKLRHNRDRLIAQLVSFVRLNLITVMTYSAIVFVAAHEVLAIALPGYVAAADAVRVLVAVAVLRAVSFVIPPLLDGMGHPDRTFTYTLIAAVSLPLSFVAGANLLGDQLGMLSVAVAWAVGYPIAFAALVLMAVYTLEWSSLRFLRSVGGVAACMLIAGAVGWLVHHVVLPDQAAGVRVIATTIAVVGVTGVLLAYTQGITLRAALRSMRADPAAPGAPVGDLDAEPRA